MNVVDIIERKRDGGRITAEEIVRVIADYTADRIPDYQMSALLMAIFKEGMSQDELSAWTDAMLHSGEVLDFSGIAAPKVDKHSTGGVGDKVSIPLAPMVAACGVAVPMMSGRGLGHTGGTLDKLESIPGFRTALDPSEFHDILERTGLVLAGQSETLVPADRQIYALRDATGTVPSIPLISSSIMSKKLAEGLDALVLDVKVGRGAFMRDLESARRLAQTMVSIGQAHDTAVTAVLTDMNTPLGNQVGNANEIAESVDILQGGGPPDLLEITFRLGEEMLLMGEIDDDRTAARSRLESVVETGQAFEKFLETVAAQGGDVAVLTDTSLLPRAEGHTVVEAWEEGYVTRADALDIGVAAVALGAGRVRKEDEIDHGVGITLRAAVGDHVESGQPLAEVVWASQDRRDEAVRLLARAFGIGRKAPPPRQLIHGEVG